MMPYCFYATPPWNGSFVSIFIYNTVLHFLMFHNTVTSYYTKMVMPWFRLWICTKTRKKSEVPRIQSKDVYVFTSVIEGKGDDTG